MVSPSKKDHQADPSTESPVDVSTILENLEEKPIVSFEENPRPPAKTAEVPVEERLKEDLKMSYSAKGILDITFGGYGFLRQDYILNPDRDIYVSTSQIRRFWLRRGDEVEGLARPPKEGERFHSLLLIKKINGEE